MLGLLSRIKSWFRRKSSGESSSTSTVTKIHSAHSSENQSLSEGNLLVQEHEQLETERSRLRKEITVVDSRYSSGEIEAGDRDRAYRLRLARAGQISMRQLEIRSQLVKMGHPIPDEWGAIQIMR